MKYIIIVLSAIIGVLSFVKGKKHNYGEGGATNAVNIKEKNMVAVNCKVTSMVFAVVGAIGSVVGAININAIYENTFLIVLVAGFVLTYIICLILYGIGEAIACACRPPSFILSDD